MKTCKTFHFTLTYTLDGVKEKRRVFVSAELPRPEGAVTVEVVISEFGKREKKQLRGGARKQLPRDATILKEAFALAKKIAPRGAKGFGYKNPTY